MKSMPPLSTNDPPRRAKRRRRLSVLVVDDEQDIRSTVADALASSTMTIHHAASITEARAMARRHRLDLALIDLKLPDGDGMELAGELQQRSPSVHSIVMTGAPSVDSAVQAIRAGATDFLPKPFNVTDLRAGVDRALGRHRDETRAADRVKRLKNLCRKLNTARHEVTQQVDILCNDLVSAYQELAEQLKHVQATTQFQTIIDQELDLEQLLRRMLEFVLQQLGPTNAAVFLPAQVGGFTVGGYINYTFDKSAADVLLTHLADVAAPRIADRAEVIHLKDNMDINLWLSDDSAWLVDCEVIGLPCHHDGEVLACLMLFRDANEPFDDEAVATLNAIAPIFGEHLVKVINIHHRHLDPDEDADTDPDEIPF
ncbi:MAG: response regulator [Planctomycetes bacterium]|nr:response regulator [Planctomycetota bacterium]